MKRLCLIVFVLFLVSCTLAFGDTFTDRGQFETAVGELTCIDFEGLATGGGRAGAATLNGDEFSGVTLTAGPNAEGMFVGIPDPDITGAWENFFAADFFPTSGVACFSPQIHPPPGSPQGRLIVDFDDPTTGVGAFFLDVEGATSYIEAFDDPGGTGNSLGKQTRQGQGDDSQAFAGVVADGIRSAVLKMGGGGDGVGIDDLCYGASEDECGCVVEQGAFSRKITPLSNPETDVDFYGYFDPNWTSASTGLEIANHSILFLYENSNTGDKSLFVIHDNYYGGGGGMAHFTFSGMPGGSYFSVCDDPEGLYPDIDEYTMDPPDAEAYWSWNNNRTDGAAIGGVGCDFKITINPEFGTWRGRGPIQFWSLLSDDVSDPDVFTLPSTSEPLTIRCASEWDLVHLDIKPTSCPNPLNVKSRGVLPVAVLGSEGYDVSQIDPLSVTLASVLAIPGRDRLEDVATPVLDPQEKCECTEEGPDGFVDLTLKFDKQEVVDALGEGIGDGDVIPLSLIGNLKEEFGGTAIRGQDCVVIIKKGKGGPTSAGIGPSTPMVFALSQNNPNPFSRETSISYMLPASGYTTLKIYDTSGRLVTTLVDAEMNAGIYSITWNRKNAASGIYFYRLTNNGNSVTRKMTVLR